jgi:hypothetical protein
MGIRDGRTPAAATPAMRERLAQIRSGARLERHRAEERSAFLWSGKAAGKGMTSAMVRRLEEALLIEWAPAATVLNPNHVRARLTEAGTAVVGAAEAN